MSKLADTSLILINLSPSNVKFRINSIIQNLRKFPVSQTRNWWSIYFGSKVFWLDSNYQNYIHFHIQESYLANSWNLILEPGKWKQLSFFSVSQFFWEMSGVSYLSKKNLKSCCYKILCITTAILKNVLVIIEFQAQLLLQLRENWKTSIFNFIIVCQNLKCLSCKFKAHFWTFWAL